MCAPPGKGGKGRGRRRGGESGRLVRSVEGASFPPWEEEEEEEEEEVWLLPFIIFEGGRVFAWRKIGWGHARVVASCRL